MRSANASSMDLHGNFARNEPLCSFQSGRNGTKLERSYTCTLLCIYPLTDNHVDAAGQMLKES